MPTSCRVELRNPAYGGAPRHKWDGVDAVPYTIGQKMPGSDTETSERSAGQAGLRKDFLSPPFVGEGP